MAGMTWDFADQLSDKIIELVRDEMTARPDFSPVELFAGLLLALFALLKTAAPTIARPAGFRGVTIAVERCLLELKEAYPEGPPRGAAAGAH